MQSRPPGVNPLLVFVLSASAACLDEPIPVADGPPATAPTARLAGTPCSPQKLAELRGPASERDFVVLDCDARLTATDVITKRVQFRGEASAHVRLDCDGARLVHGGDTVQIFSQRRVAADGAVTWEPAHDVTITGCVIKGAIRIWGLGLNGQHGDVLASSHQAGHTERARAAAPHRIAVHATTIVGDGRVPLYLGPGVHDSSFVGLEISGGTGSLAVYFDAETTGNTLRGSHLHTDSLREQLALDGSSGNTIIENRFSSITGGGIFLYRNCGEGGAVRHATPSGNVIMNNVFDFTGGRIGAPAVWVAARRGNRRYCGDDATHRFGSGLDDDDHATGNLVMQNQAVSSTWWSVADLFRSDEAGPNAPNFLEANRVVSAETVEPTGCVLAPSPLGFLADGETRTLIAPDGTCALASCRDQVVTRSACTTRAVPFGCIARGNQGCSGVVSCPAGTEPVTARAVCNLEWPDVRWPHVLELPMGLVRVSRPSDHVYAGHCRVDDLDLQLHEAWLPAQLAGPLRFGCVEHDVNGGECQIRGQLLCRDQVGGAAARPRP